MRKSRSQRKSLQREFTLRRKAKPGFPWKGVFQTREQVEAYFAGDKIQCLLCGRWFKQISTSHMERVHEMTLDEYRERYKLPWGRGLTGQTTHKNMSQRGTQRARDLIARDEPFFKEQWPLDFPDRKARRHQNFLLYRRWHKEDYEAILTRVQQQQRSLSDVCQDSDLPGYFLWRRFVAQHPEFEQRLKQIYASWPYPVQAKILSELSSQFTADCRRLHTQGLSQKQIADALEVNVSAVIRHLKTT